MASDKILEFLQESLGSEVTLHLKGGTSISGTVNGFDQHLNIIIDSTSFRGDSIMRVSMTETEDSISVPDSIGISVTDSESHNSSKKTQKIMSDETGPIKQSDQSKETLSTDFQSESADMLELREQAWKDAVEEVLESYTTTQQSSPEYTRSATIRKYVKARANGHCEGCGKQAPFVNRDGEPYLHAHHVHELSKGGKDTPDTVVALCPNCHYRVHHGKDGDEYNQELRRIVKSLE